MRRKPLEAVRAGRRAVPATSQEIEGATPSIAAEHQDIPPRRLYLFEMTWPQVRAALPNVKAAIIPTGSTEQHGPHGTFEVDTARAREFSLRLAERVYPHALVTPCIDIGVSPHHIHFPGTLALRPETFTDVVMDVATSLLQHGIRRFMFLNGHGGNKAPLSVVVNRLRQEYGARAVLASPTAVVDDIIKEKVFSPIKGHACESEMSQVLYLWPSAMKMEYAEKGRIKEHVKADWGKIAVEEGRFWEDLTENGALGDATLSTEALGKELIEASLDRLTEYLQRFMES